ncbi:MAG: lipoprotein insertase outer membrane protein LolB [Limnohabitans sp.]
MKRRLAATVLCLLLCACATPPRERTEAVWSGRIGLQVQSDPPQSLQASFELEGSPQAGLLTLFNPIGGILARLSWTPQQAMLERGTERWTQPTVEQLAEQLVQTPFPVQALFDWVEGRSVSHAGWQVDLSEHVQGRITAMRRLPAPAAEMRIVLDR